MLKKFLLIIFSLTFISLFVSCDFEMMMPHERIVYVTSEKTSDLEEEKFAESDLKESKNEESPEVSDSEKSSQLADEAANLPEEKQEEKTETEDEQKSESILQTESEVESEKQATVEIISETENVAEGENATQAEIEIENQKEAETESENTSEPESAEATPVESELPEIPLPAKLTLIIYMAADNDLEKYAIQNLKDMEHAEYENINVIALVDRAENYDETNGNWTDTRLLEIVHDDSDSGLLLSKRMDCPPLGLSARLRTELDMGNYNVLKNLINFAKSEYEAEQYALVIWGHGTGWRYGNSAAYRAIGIDDKSDTYMSVSDMGKALENQNLAVIGFDTCFGGTFENLYELKDSAEYLVASPGAAPSSGWNYKKILESISQREVSASDIAGIMAENSLVHTSVINTSRLQNIMNTLEEFSEKLASTITDSTSKNQIFNLLFNAKSFSYSQYPCDLYLDMYDMANHFVDSEDSELAECAENFKMAVSRAGYTNKSQYVEIGLHFIPLRSAHTASLYHSIDYLKDDLNLDQCAFIKNSEWWVPTINNDSGSLLDKIFYQ